MSTGRLPSRSMTTTRRRRRAGRRRLWASGTTPARAAWVPPDLTTWDTRSWRKLDVHTRGHACVAGREETLQRSASSEYSLVKAERLSPYESLWVDSPEALADSAGSASTSI